MEKSGGGVGVKGDRERKSREGRREGVGGKGR